MDTPPIELIKTFISFLIFVVGAIGLISSRIYYLSVRASICNQIYGRWQTLLLAQDEETSNDLSKDSFDADNATNNKRGAAHHIAIAYLNLYEEAFFYHKSRLFFIFRLLPNTLWKSIQRSAENQINDLPYLKTMWEFRKDSYADDFVDYVDNQILTGKYKNNKRRNSRSPG